MFDSRYSTPMASLGRGSGLTMQFPKGLMCPILVQNMQSGRSELWSFVTAHTLLRSFISG